MKPGDHGLKGNNDIVTVLVGESQPIFTELLTALVREAVGEDCELKVHYTDKADDLVYLAKAQQVDLFILFLNNILFPVGNLPSENRMSRVMRLVWDLKMEYDKPIIGICGLPEYEDYSRIAGVDVFFAAPFRYENFIEAVRNSLSDFTGRRP